MMQPFEVERTELVSDGLNGRIGVASVVYKSLGEFTPIKAKRSLEAAQTTLKAAQSLKCRNNEAFIWKTSDTVIFREKRYTIQTLDFADDTRMWYLLTLLEQGKPNAPGTNN